MESFIPLWTLQVFTLYKTCVILNCYYEKFEVDVLPFVTQTPMKHISNELRKCKFPSVWSYSISCYLSYIPIVIKTHRQRLNVFQYVIHWHQFQVYHNMHEFPG